MEHNTPHFEPDSLESLDRETLIGMIDDFAKNWLAHDGLWSLAMEKEFGMEAAIAADTEAWRRFSPVEAKRIMTRHQIEENGGIPALIKALGFRMYARLNKQEIVEQTDVSVVFRMNECRVQSARYRKGMALFPCKSVGIVEYTEFAKTIDPRLVTEVITCPPDVYNKEYYCAWKFTLK